MIYRHAFLLVRLHRNAGYCFLSNVLAAKVAATAIQTVSIASSRRGLFSAGYFLLKEQSSLHNETDFCIKISIELKLKIAKRVINRFV